MAKNYGYWKTRAMKRIKLHWIGFPYWRDVTSKSDKTDISLSPASKNTDTSKWRNQTYRSEMSLHRDLSQTCRKKEKKKAIPRLSLPPWRQMITIIPIRFTLCKHRSFCTNFYTANGCCILVRVLCYISVTFTVGNICVFFSFKRHSFINNNLSFRNKFVFCYFRTFVWLFTSFGSTLFNIEGGYR